MTTMITKTMTIMMMTMVIINDDVGEDDDTMPMTLVMTMMISMASALLPVPTSTARAAQTAGRAAPPGSRGGLNGPNDGALGFRKQQGCSGGRQRGPRRASTKDRFRGRMFACSPTGRT